MLGVVYKRKKGQRPLTKSGRGDHGIIINRENQKHAVVFVSVDRSDWRSSARISTGTLHISLRQRG